MNKYFKKEGEEIREEKKCGKYIVTFFAVILFSLGYVIINIQKFSEPFRLFSILIILIIFWALLLFYNYFSKKFNSENLDN